VRIERLVTMANDIGAFFATDPDRHGATSNVANHLQRFWDPRMRRQIVSHYLDAGGAGLDEIPLAAVALLAQGVTLTDTKPGTPHRF
jgi:formate dehydrogenase subunit delta